MSTKYTGGFITKSPVAPTTTAASGIWTLDQQQQAQKAGTWPSPPIFIEDLFSTYLYTGNGSTQTIINGVDLSTKGGLVWQKVRDPAGYRHFLFDTVRGVNNYISTNTTDAQVTQASSLTSFNSNGFTLGSDSNVNGSGINSVSWTFREQPKFFDVVTYTGTGVGGQTVAHNLGSAPGMVIIKVTSEANDWIVWHRGLTSGYYVKLNTTAAQSNTNAIFFFGNGTTTVDPTSSVITLGGSGLVSGSGKSYVAYLFAHDAGGFPVSGGGSTNGISCGSYTGNGVVAGPSVTLGYEPQWVLVKSSTVAGSNWFLMDNMRGMAYTLCNELYADLSAAEVAQSKTIIPTATGFDVATTDAYINNSGSTYIYIAIRRGPMKTPTVGTSVFSPIAAVSGVQTTNFPVDMQILSSRDTASALMNHQVIDRLRGVSSTSTAQGNYLNTTSTAAETSASPFSSILMSNVGFQVGNNYAGGSGVFHSFQRAPSFFDSVCYTGTGSATTVTHNLGVVPELMIVKRRSTSGSSWAVYVTALGNAARLELDTTGAVLNVTGVWNNTTPTASVFSIGTPVQVNQSGETYVNYLFATCAGVSKVGSYTGNGSSQTIACGFTGGSRWVMIKRTDSTGDWYVWDSARGIVAGNDPHLSLNTTAAEVTTDDSVDTDNSGFIVNQDAATNINVTSATYIFLAIA